MAWIKRNLYFVITVVVALGLAGYCGYLLFSALNENAKASDDYATASSSLKDLQDKKPFPSKENIQAAEEDAARVRAFKAEFQKAFSGFPTPPKMDDRQFKDYLQKTIYQFGADATNAGVGLNPGYVFAFSQQMDKLNYPSECIAPWMQEMEEMKVILNIFYKAKINFLEKIRRPPVSPNDTGGDDYTKFGTVSNQNGVVTPYTVEFRAFSAEIADVLAGISASSNCFIVKTIFVSKSLVPLPQVAQLPAALAPAPQIYYRPRPQPRPDMFAPQGRDRSDRRSQRMTIVPQGPVYTTPSEPSGPSGPVTILTETPLFVTIYIDVVKLKPAEAVAPAAAHKPRTAGR